MARIRLSCRSTCAGGPRPSSAAPHHRAGSRRPGRAGGGGAAPRGACCRRHRTISRRAVCGGGATDSAVRAAVAATAAADIPAASATAAVAAAGAAREANVAPLSDVPALCARLRRWCGGGPALHPAQVHHDRRALEHRAGVHQGRAAQPPGGRADAAATARQPAAGGRRGRGRRAGRVVGAVQRPRVPLPARAHDDRGATARGRAAPFNPGAGADNLLRLRVLRAALALPAAAATRAVPAICAAPGAVPGAADGVVVGESFARVYWVAVPKALRARRVNRDRR
jgi:hypothetical protein